MEQEAAKLIATLNSALEAGLDKLPANAEMLVNEFAKYSLSASIAFIAAAVVSLFCAPHFARKAAHYFDADDFEPLVVIYGTLAFVSFIAFFPFAVEGVSHFLRWANPIGWLVSKAIN